MINYVQNVERHTGKQPGVPNPEQLNDMTEDKT